jgi:putative flippase GtrA
MKEKLQNLKNKHADKLRFLIVGGSSTVLDFGILNILVFLGVDTLIANTISTFLSMIFSFFMNKSFTFKSSSKNYKREVFLFVVFTLIGLWVIQNGVIQGLLLVIPQGLPEFVRLNAAKLIATAFSMVWNFTTYKKFVFKNEKDD